MDTNDLHINNDLTKLRKYLNYNISTGALFILSFLTFGLIFLVAIAAIIFTPFMLSVLYKENKKGWIISFLVLVLIPFIVTTTFTFLGLTSFPWFLIIIALFYFYCFFLRLEVNNWVRERRVKLQYLLEKQRRDEETEVFLSQLDK